MIIKNKINSIVILSLIIALHLVFVFASINKPFQGDEVNFIHTTEAIKNNGNPSAFYSLAHPLYEGNSQPLLYYYFLALSTTLFGDSLIAWRLASIIFNIGVIILVYYTALLVLEKKEENKKWALLASALYALNPLTIQSSIILDIDGGVLNFFTLLFAFLFLKNTKPIYLVFSLFLVFWSKMTGPTILLGSLFFYLLFTKRKDKKIKIKESIFIAASATLLFLSTYWLYVSYYKLRFLTLFEHGSVTSNIFSFASAPIPFILRSAWSFKSFFYFATPFLVLLFLSLLFIFLKNKYYIKNDKALFAGILALITMLVFFAYGATSFNFPKYYTPALPFMAIFSGFMLKKINFKINLEKKNLRCTVLVILIALYFIFLLKDPLIPEVDSTLATISLNEALILVLIRFALYVILPVIIAGVIFYKARLKNKWFIILISLTFILYLYLAITQATADYSTHQQYGVRGTKDAALYLKNKNVSSQNVAAYPAVGYYLGYNKYYDLTFVYNDKEKLKKEVLENKEVKYIIMLKKDFDRIGRENLADFEEETKIGDYYVLKRIEA